MSKEVKGIDSPRDENAEDDGEIEIPEEERS